MKRMRVLWLAAAVCGCSGGADQGPERPAAAVVRLQEDAAQAERERPMLSLLAGEDRRSLGAMLAASVEEELRGRGLQLAADPGGGATAEELAAALRRSGDADGIVWVRMGRWNLDAVTGGNVVTVEFEIALHRVSDGAVLWREAVGPRTVTLRAGEARDIAAFTRRVAIEALRSFP